MKYSLTLTQSQLEKVKRLIFKSDGYERPALLLCGRSSIDNHPWDGGSEERFLGYNVIPVPESEIIDHSENHVNWDTTTLRRVMKMAKKGNYAICAIHNHLSNLTSYSQIDNDNEPDLYKGIFNRNGPGEPHLSLVITANDQLFGRIWTSNLSSEPIEMIRVIGDRFSFHYPDNSNATTSDVFHRQQLAFGNALTKDLSKLTVGVIGAGATGSATGELLSRLGVGRILLVDDDHVERTNLNRLHGATASDADAGRPKVEILRDFIASAGIGTSVRIIKSWVGSEECRNALKSCDFIFGCTDDNSGRIFLNRFAHFYLVPVFDMGIIIDLDEDKKIRSLLGRLTVINHGNTCLLCQGIVDVDLAREEDVKRSDPKGFQRLKEEGYVRGSGNPSPSVVTFTTEISCVAVNEFLNRIIGYKKNGVQNNLMRFFDQGLDRKPGGLRREDCPICDSEKNWGRGDVKPFMNQAY